MGDERLSEYSVCGDGGAFLRRLLAREEHGGDSARFFYGAPGTVPFGWESEPGTPKRVLNLAEAEGLTGPLSAPPSCRCSRTPSFVSEASSSSSSSCRRAAPVSFAGRIRRAAKFIRGKLARPKQEAEDFYVWRPAKSWGKKVLKIGKVSGKPGCTFAFKKVAL